MQYTIPSSLDAIEASPKAGQQRRHVGTVFVARTVLPVPEGVFVDAPSTEPDVAPEYSTLTKRGSFMTIALIRSLLILMLAAPAAFSQNIFGSFTGVVTDLQRQCCAECDWSQPGIPERRRFSPADQTAKAFSGFAIFPVGVYDITGELSGFQKFEAARRARAGGRSSPRRYQVERRLECRDGTGIRPWRPQLTPRLRHSKRLSTRSGLRNFR